MESIGPLPMRTRTGWASRLAQASFGLLLFEAVSGLAITISPFHPAVQWGVLIHTLAGVLGLLPVVWYCWRHWLDYRHYAASHTVVLGYLGLISLLACSVSGVVLAWEGLFGVRTTPFWAQVHWITTLVFLGSVAPHLGFAFWRVWESGAVLPWRRWAVCGFGCAGAGLAAMAVLAALYSGPVYDNQLPADYVFLYGTNRPFAPSLAKTETGGAFDARSLAGSFACGTAGCHQEILEEWKPSAHRYAAMDTVFQGIQNVMAQQNGAESTRYCGGCHDPISLFSGTKNLFVENLTGLHGYQEGVSCLACHAIRETDVKGNANYTVTQPAEYLWQWQTNGLLRVARDFLIRTYPEEHTKLSKRMFKKPEYCAACHKQFIDQEVNRVGWVQLQNQYDNWAASHWNHKGDATKTVECRECHMPLVDSRDPAAGDSADYNRTTKDRKHRSHRFIASNQLMPKALALEGWAEQVQLTEQWLKGEMRVPEIAHKWAEGPIVKIGLQVPECIAPGETIPLRVVLASNKVGHDYPTGPLDIIQSWLVVEVKDDAGRVVFSSGKRDSNNFIQPGTFLFKAEPVDQHGNLIDRHNLWEMVGVRYRRALFPGYSDTVQFQIPCAGAVVSVNSTNASGALPNAGGSTADTVELPPQKQPGEYKISVGLQYRKVDQFLLNYLFGATNQLTSPVTEIARATAVVQVKPKPHASFEPDRNRSGLAKPASSQAAGSYAANELGRAKTTSSAQPEPR